MIRIVINGVRGFSYPKAMMVEVNQDSVRQSLAQADRMLGFSPQNYDFRIEYMRGIPREGELAGSANFLESTFILPKVYEDGTLLHEATHYAMGKRGLHLIPDPKNWTAYQRLINETFAEMAATRKYGASIPLAFLESMNAAKEGLSESPETKLDNLIDPESGFILSQICVDIGFMHEGGSLEKLCMLDKTKEAFGKNWNDIKKAIQRIAYFNAFKLNVGGVKISDLRAELEQAKRQNMSPFEFYMMTFPRRVWADSKAL
jgi:hypothetical protein